MGRGVKVFACFIHGCLLKHVFDETRKSKIKNNKSKKKKSYLPFTNCPSGPGHSSSMWEATGLESLGTKATATALPQDGNARNLNSLNRQKRLHLGRRQK